MAAFDRRSLLQLLIAAGTARLLGGAAPAAAATGLEFGPPQPFSYDWLKQHARDLAAQPYREPPRPDPAIVSRIDYDAHGKLRFRKQYSLYRHSAYPISFQHVGMFFPKTVKMHAVDGATAREIIYDPTYFTVGEDHVARGLGPQPSAFAGFWVHEPDRKGDLDKVEPWATFLGASYFRGVGELGQVGLSARGIALAPGAPGPEEFPDFVSYWFEPATSEAAPVTVYALLHGPSVAGSYRFVMHRTSGVVMDIEASIHPRRTVERLGLAPLTSMYWFSETYPTRVDWRPEVHDSDGLALWTGAGERIWRPLNNPPTVMISSFLDERPRGFGLSQRDRNFDHYLDGVKYDKRPSAWVEPVGDWGRGKVQLVELPTDDEIHDNICAMWVPDAPHGAGSHIDIAYRLHWLADEPFPTRLGRCVATRLGNGGQPGQPRPGPNVRKFMVEFLGGPLAELPMGQLPEAVLTASRGTFSYIFTEAVPNDVPGHWRAQFDLTVDGTEPVELRCFLRTGSIVLTETWLYQYHPTVR